MSNIDLLIWLKKKRGIQKGEEKNENILKMPLFSHLLSTNKISYSQKAESIIEKREGELMIFVTLGVFSKIQKSLRAKEEHITKICQI